MNRFVKLLNWEINRFAKLFAVLCLITLLSQFIGLFLYVRQFMNQLKEVFQINAMTISEYFAHHYQPAVFLNYSQTLWFYVPIGLGVTTLLLYVFLIWYREWVGKGAFIYRLLMLPTARMNVYLAKMSAILLFVLGLVTFQALILIPEIHWFNAMIPSVFRNNMSLDLIEIHPSLLSLLIPRYLVQLFLDYGAGLMIVVVIFTAILLERSFRLKGIVAGVLYGILAGFVFLLPVLISTTWYPNYFYPSEIVKMEIIAGIFITSSSLWISSYLLTKRVTL